MDDKFTQKDDVFLKNYCMGMLLSILFFAFCTCLFWYTSLNFLSEAVEDAILFILFVWIIYDLYGFKSAKKIAEEFYVQLFDDGILIYKNKMLYDDLSLHAVKKDANGQVKKIILKTAFNQKISLRYLNDMESLYDQLKKNFDNVSKQ